MPGGTIWIAPRDLPTIPPMILRRKTRQISIGNEKTGVIRIGGDSPVSVQSMTAGYTHEIDNCVAEINELAGAGADIVRVVVPERKDTEALVEILNQTNVPIVADVHFHYQRALEAIKAGVHKIRLNPGNINDRDQVNAVIDACRERSLPIRVGVNEGSIIERKDKRKRKEELGRMFSASKHGHLIAIMIAKILCWGDLKSLSVMAILVVPPGTRKKVPALEQKPPHSKTPISLTTPMF